MALSERLALLITADTTGAVREVKKLGDTSQKELGRSEAALDRWGNRLTSTGAAMMATGAVLAAGLFNAAMGASQLEQAIGATEVVFRDAGSQVEEYAETAASSMGLSRRAYLENVNSIGALLNNMGFAREESAEWANQLTQLGADLSAAFGGKPEEAVHALGRALVGEFDPLERFNVSIRQADINLKAVEMNLASSTSQVDKSARAQAALALITEQTSDIQGQFGRETETTAGRLAVAQAEFANAKDELGTGLLPIMTRLLGVGSGAVDLFNSLPPGVRETTGTVAGLTSGFLLFGGAASFVVGQVIKMRENFATARDGVKGLIDRMGGLRGAAVPAAIGVGLLTTAVLANKKAQADAKARTQEFVAAMESEAEGAANATEELIVKKLAEEDLIGALAEHGVTARTVIEALAGEEAAMKKVNDAAGELSGGQLIALGNITGAHLSAQDVVADTTAGMEDAGIATEGAGEAADMAAAEMKDLASEYEDAKKKVDDAIGSMEDWFNLIDDNLSANIDYQAAIDDLTQSIIDNGLTFDIQEEAGRKNVEAMQEVRNAILDLGMAELEASGSTQAATEKTLGMVEAFRQQMLQAGYTETEVDHLLTTLGLTPEQVNTQFNTPGLQQAITDARLLEAQLALIPRVVDVAVRVASSLPGGGGFGFNPFASPQAAPNSAPAERQRPSEVNVFLDGEKVSRPLGRVFNRSSRSVYGRPDA